MLQTHTLDIRLNLNSGEVKLDYRVPFSDFDPEEAPKFYYNGGLWWLYIGNIEVYADKEEELFLEPWEKNKIEEMVTHEAHVFKLALNFTSDNRLNTVPDSVPPTTF